MSKLINVEPAEDLQKMAHNTGKMVGNQWVNEGVSKPLVSKDERKTGKISDAANNNLQSFGASSSTATN